MSDAVFHDDTSLYVNKWITGFCRWRDALCHAVTATQRRVTEGGSGLNVFAGVHAVYDIVSLDPPHTSAMLEAAIVGLSQTSGQPDRSWPGLGEPL